MSKGDLTDNQLPECETGGCNREASKARRTVNNRWSPRCLQCAEAFGDGMMHGWVNAYETYADRPVQHPGVECLDCGSDMAMADPPSTPGPAVWECRECQISTADDLWDILVQEA